MKSFENQTAGIKKLEVPKRKAVSISKENLVVQEFLETGGTPLLVFKPDVEGINLPAWGKENRCLIDAQLLVHGAILFRGFNMRKASEFEEFIKSTAGETLQYHERSSPRARVSGNVYTSTDYPPHQSIFLHNENSYQYSWPMRIFFFCMVAPIEGGRTPIADTRKVFESIPASTRDKFIQKKVLYVRNFGKGMGLPWQTVFQTDDKAEVERYCRAAKIGFLWVADDQLKTFQAREAVARHPKTGQMVWFNHATFFNVSTLEPPVRDGLLSQFKEEDLPSNTYYGDGSAIEGEALDELRAAYKRHRVSFAWKQGDVLMLDNMLTAHGRDPFAGERKIVVGMAEPLSWDDV